MAVRAVYIAPLLMLCTACASNYPPQKFRTLDAFTGRPLAGVVLSQQNILSKDMIIGVRCENVVYHSGDDGLITTRELPSDAEITFHFSLNGYSPSNAMPSYPGMQIWSPDDASHASPATQYSTADVTTIPMYPVNADGKR